MKPDKGDNCVLCNRSQLLTFHHLVPKKLHDNKIVQKRFEGIELIHYGEWLCKDCHKKIHKLFTHKELAESYYSLDLLRNNEAFQDFLNWVSKQRKSVKH